MATLTMAGQSMTRQTGGKECRASVLTAPETSSKETGLLDRMAQVYWRISFEVEPFVKGFFAPFTAAIKTCRLLSGREKDELEAVMKRR